MYAQNPRGTDLPRNYSGNAFRYPPIRTESEPLVEQVTVETPTGEEEARETQPAEAASAVAQSGDETLTRHLSLPLFGGRGIGSEELLLLGMLLLLGGEGQNELMMCLLLLLFCG